MKCFSLLVRLLFLAFVVSGFKIQEDHRQQFSTAGKHLDSTATLGVKKDIGWKEVSVQDPVVQDAADHAVKTIQQRSNSLFPYQLKQIVSAKSQVVDDSVKFEMVLNLNRGVKEEKFKVEVVKNSQGSFSLSRMEKIN